MDHQDFRTLKILEEIDNGHMPSQRDLARKLNVSLGLVNSFIKRLAHKGYFKISTIPKNRVKYILTPKGAAEKVRLTYEYIHSSIQYYKDTRNKLRALFEDLTKQGVKRVVFFGMTDLTEIAYISLQETPLFLVGVLDKEHCGKKFMGIKIEDPIILTELIYDRILIMDVLLKNEIMKCLTELNISSSKIIAI